MTMAESAVEDAAAAPPGPAKPPPPSCTNNNTLSATANRNHHRASRKRRRLNQVLDDLNAHKSLPADDGQVSSRLEMTSVASEDDDDNAYAGGRSGGQLEQTVGSIAKRLKPDGPYDEIGNAIYRSYYGDNQDSWRRENRLGGQIACARVQKYCPCPNWLNRQATNTVLLPSPTSPLTPPTTASLTPLTPLSPASYSFEHYFNTKYMPEVGRKRSHSDSDVRRDERANQPGTQRSPRGGSLENETSGPQESPLDLSMKNLALVANAPSTNNNNSAYSNNNRPSALQLMPASHVTRGTVSVPVVRGDVASPTTKESVASRYNLEVSPVVEEMPPGADVAYVCPVCGQMFSLHDRLAKHMASRHRRQGARDTNAKAYRCEVCKRSFARSDMLTRHMRLHTGVKPYTCKVCNQVFSRSDHLSTHQRTHTGEKPYKCPQCVYAACRRDMITRHLRTHAKIGDGQASAKVEAGIGNANAAESESPSYGLDPLAGIVKTE